MKLFYQFYPHPEDLLSDIDFVQKITFTEDYYQGSEKQFIREIKKRFKQFKKEVL